MISLSVFPMPEDVDLPRLKFLYLQELDRQMDLINEAAVPFVDLAKRLLARAESEGLQARWSYSQWSGIMVQINLRKDDGFDRLFDYHEECKAEVLRLSGILTTDDRSTVVDPKPADYPEMKRRAWTFKAGPAVMTLAGFGAYDSDICRMVQVGTEPKYELVCAGSPLPAGAAP
jgi:hypothetical protein